MRVNLYLLSQTINDDYDTFDSCIVAAENVDDARLITPIGTQSWGAYNCWAPTPDKVNVKLIGVASEDIEPNTIILASFNAG